MVMFATTLGPTPSWMVPFTWNPRRLTGRSNVRLPVTTVLATETPWIVKLDVPVPVTDSVYEGSVRQMVPPIGASAVTAAWMVA